MNPQRRFVIFDMDGTVTRGDSMFDLLASSIRRRPSRLIGAPAAVARAAWQLSSGQRTRAKESMLHLVFAGLDHKGVQEVAALAASRVSLNPSVLRRIEEHHSAGDEVWIASASPRPVVEHVADRVGIINVVATELDFDSGVATGRLRGSNCRGNEKLRRLDAVLPGGWRSWAVAYSDDLDADGPLLAASAKAFLVRGEELREVVVP